MLVFLYFFAITTSCVFLILAFVGGEDLTRPKGSDWIPPTIVLGVTSALWYLVYLKSI